MKRSFFAILALLMVGGLTLSGCCSSPDNATPAADPTPAPGTADNNGIVVIQDWTRIGSNDFVMKACDGTTLLYLTAGGYGSSGIAAIPGSPECGATAAAEEPAG